MEAQKTGIKVMRKSMHGLYDFEGNVLIPCKFTIKQFKEELKRLAGNQKE
ncbi:MAG: hypothetical protein AAFY76_25685 [Cyanobacteria bacterium J06649_11]